MSEKAEITKWVASSAKFLQRCDPDMRIAALSLLYSKVILEGVFQSPSLDPGKRDKAETDLAKHFVNTMAEFVYNGRESWRKKAEV